MEQIHNSSKRAWISEKIVVKQFRDKWYSFLNEKDSAPEESKNLRDLISHEEYATLEKSCGMEPEVSTIQEPSYEYSRSFIIPEDVELETLKTQKQDLDRRKTDSQYECVVYHNFKCYNYPPNKITGQESLPNDIQFEDIQEPEVLLTVQIYRPEQKNLQYLRTTLGRLPAYRIDQEFMVLGCQYLTELRDNIECISDKAISGEMSECPDMSITVTCKDLYKSGTFYIDGVFYNDMRDPDCRDYSSNIIKWAKDPSRGLGPFHTAAMEKTKFIDLTVQLGYPYVYIHQGHCEHLIVFSDIKMFSHHDLCNRNAYPMVVTVRPKKIAFCMICHVYVAEWVTSGNKRLPEDPFLFCKNCFFGFNYDENNQKIGTFSAYRFFGRSSLT